MKALKCPTAECYVPSKHGMDVSCCLASCSPITRGNHLSTGDVLEELKLCQPGASVLLWAVSDELCCLSCATSDSSYLLVLRETLLTSRFLHPTGACLEVCPTSWLTQRSKRINFCCFFLRDLQAASLYLVTCTWEQNRLFPELQTHQELKMGDSTFPISARLHHPTPMVLSPALSHSREVSSQYRAVQRCVQNSGAEKKIQ